MTMKHNFAFTLRCIFGGVSLLVFAYLAFVINGFLLDVLKITTLGIIPLWLFLVSWAGVAGAFIVLLIKLISAPLDTLESFAVGGSVFAICVAVGLVIFAIGSLSIVMALIAAVVAGAVALLISAMCK